MIWPALGVAVSLTIVPAAVEHFPAAPAAGTHAPAPVVPSVGKREQATGAGLPAVLKWPWTALARCESGGNWHINTGNGFYGGLQFSLSSWRGVGGRGLPSDATPQEQIRRAVMLQRLQGWGAWPVCSVEAGL